MGCGGSYKGRSKSVHLRPDEVALAQHQTAEYKRFHAISVAFIRASEELAEARRMALRAGDAAKGPRGLCRRVRCAERGHRGGGASGQSWRVAGGRQALWCNTSTPITATNRAPAWPSTAALSCTLRNRFCGVARPFCPPSKQGRAGSGASVRRRFCLPAPIALQMTPSVPPIVERQGSGDRSHG